MHTYVAVLVTKVFTVMLNIYHSLNDNEKGGKTSLICFYKFFKLVTAFVVNLYVMSLTENVSDVLTSYIGILSQNHQSGSHLPAKFQFLHTFMTCIFYINHRRSLLTLTFTILDLIYLLFLDSDYKVD